MRLCSLLTLLLALLMPTMAMAQAPTEGDQATIQVQQWAIGLPDLILFLDDEPLIANISYEGPLATASVPADTHTLVLAVMANPAEEVIYQLDDFEMEAGETYRITLWGDSATPDSLRIELTQSNAQTMAVFTNQHPRIRDGKGVLVTLQHLGIDVPPVDIRMTDGTVLIQNLPLEEEAVLELLPGDYSLLITESGNPSAVLVKLERITLRAGMWYNIHLIGRLADLRAGSQLVYSEATCLNPAGCQ